MDIFVPSPAFAEGILAWTRFHADKIGKHNLSVYTHDEFAMQSRRGRSMQGSENFAVAYWETSLVKC